MIGVRWVKLTPNAWVKERRRWWLFGKWVR